MITLYRIFYDYTLQNLLWFYSLGDIKIYRVKCKIVIIDSTMRIISEILKVFNHFSIVTEPSNRADVPYLLRKDVVNHFVRLRDNHLFHLSMKLKLPDGLFSCEPVRYVNRKWIYHTLHTLKGFATITSFYTCTRLYVFCCTKGNI